jgi:glycosyltransferase involved in cell wall biosynthesis
MKILAVIDSFGFGGAETQLAAVLQLLTERRGHECLLCSVLPQQRSEVLIGDHIERVYLNKTSRLSLPRATGQLARVVRRYRPDVVYSRLPLANGLSRIATKLPGCRVRHVAGVDTAPDLYTWSHARQHPGNVVFRWLERYADRIICNSNGTARGVLAIGYSGARVRVIPNGIDVEHFHPPSHRRSHHPTRLVCTASLRPEKGVERLVRLLAPSLAQGQITLTVVGDGVERTKVEEVISNLNLGEAVQLLGARQDVVTVLQGADVYVSAAYVEGFGIAVAEAGATGIPAVCMAAPGGLDEVIVEGVTGYLIPPDREDLFRETVRRLGSDAELRERLGAAAREHVAAQFSIQDIARRLEACLLTE